MTLTDYGEASPIIFILRGEMLENLGEILAKSP